MAEDCTDPKANQLSVAFPNAGAKSASWMVEGCDPTTNPAFNVTAIASASHNYKQLSSLLNKLIGFEVRWFRAVPQQRSKDVIFQTYTLSNVEDEPKCIKVVLGAQGFPDSKYNFDIAGLEYEIPLEIYIDKLYWESEVGFGTAPQEKDIVYFPLPNRLYEVQSSYLWRGFAEQETAWKINLRKYTPEVSRRIGPDLSGTIDRYTVSAKELFGEEMRANMAKTVNDKQFNQFSGTEKDKYRTLAKGVIAKTGNLEIYGTIVAQSYYELFNSEVYNAVTYNACDAINDQDNRCITAWGLIDSGLNHSYDVEYIIPFTAEYDDRINFQVKLKTRTKEKQLGETMVISRPGSLNFYATIIDTSMGSSAFNVRIDDSVIDHLASIKPSWMTAKGYKAKMQEPLSIIDGLNKDIHGFRVDVYANQYVKIVYGTQEHIAIVPQRLIDKKWYGFVVNVGNLWGQYNVSVYQQHPVDAVSKLQSVFYNTIPFIPEPIVIDRYTINKSPGYVTNIRVYTMTMEEEKHKRDLLSYFVPDGDKLIIGDNADPIYKPPYIGRQR